MPLTTGQCLSFYEILGPLGAGAMGEVYRAKDARLDREVAIKVLPEQFAEDEERLRRFEREAKSLASLNHPNVAQIFSVDQVDDTCFLVMELVPGETLEERIARGALPIDDAVDVCRQIAEGLEAAHDAGVIHRDLKPANVRITPDGKVKVLDFGLAKPTGPDVGTASTTDSVLATEEGRLLGTPTYMAPEQARGRPVDRRVDVWAFGCVLFECLTAARAFGGADVADVLVAVLERDWDADALPAATSVRVRGVLERCLDKDPRSRLRDIGEARVLLEREPAERAQLPDTARGHLVPLIVVALVLGALGIGVFVGRLGVDPRSASVAPAAYLRRLTELAGMEEMPAISRDGKVLAFVARVDGKRQVFVRLLPKGVPDQVTSGDFDHSFPRWADESTLIYYRHVDEGDDRGSLWERAYLGSSAPKLLVPSAEGEADVGRAGRTIATFRNDAQGPALVLVERGGGDETLRRLPATAVYSSPRWSPDARLIAFQALVGLSASEIRVMDLLDGTTRTVVATGQVRGLAWLPDGSGLVYSSSKGSTLPYPPVFGLRTVRIDGNDDVVLRSEDAGYASYVEPDVSEAGELVASRVRMESDIFRYPVDGSPLDNVRKATQITHQTGRVQVPSASPDDAEVVYLSDSGGHSNLWIAPADGSGSARPITFEEDVQSIIGVPVWSRVGDRIVYWRGTPKRAHPGAELYLINRDGTGQKPLVRCSGGASWSPDGEWVYYVAAGDVASSAPDTYKRHADGGAPVLVRRGAAGILLSSDSSTGYFIPTAFRQGELYKATPVETGEGELLIKIPESRIPLWPNRVALSPDDDWLATSLIDDGTTNLWRISTEDGTLEQVTDFGGRATMIGRQVSWSSDSKFIFAALMETDADIVLLDGALQ